MAALGYHRLVEDPPLGALAELPLGPEDAHPVDGGSLAAPAAEAVDEGDPAVGLAYGGEWGRHRLGGIRRRGERGEREDGRCGGEDRRMRDVCMVTPSDLVLDG